MGASMIQYSGHPAGNSVGGTGTTFSLTSDLTTTAGDLLVFTLGWSSLTAEDIDFVGGTGSNVDSAGNTWVRAAATVRNSTSDSSTSVWYVLSAAGGQPTIKLTFASSVTLQRGDFAEASGGTFTVDQVKTVNGTNTTSYTPATANELGICAAMANHSNGAVQSITGYTQTQVSYPTQYFNTNCGTGLQNITLVNNDGGCCCCVPGDTLAMFVLFKVAASTSAPQDPIGFGAEA